MTIYAEILNKCLDACSNFRKKIIDINELHQTISWAEQEIVSFEEKELRNFFMLIENEIDYLRVMNNETDFMYDPTKKEADISSQTIPLLDKIETECKKWLLKT